MLDVILSDLDAAHALRPRIETMARELIPTLLTQAFDMAVPPDLHLTLERLDMDLGTLRPDHLEDDMKAALQGAISDALADALHAARQAPSKAARLSGSQAHALTHLESYLATGLLRFQRQARAFDARTQLQFLAANQPADLLAMLRRHRRDRLLLERLMLQAGESGMTELLTVLTPLDKFAIVALLADVMTVFRCVDTPALDGVGETVLRRSLWITTLEFLLNDAGSSFNRRRFLAFLLQREATRLGIDYRSLLHLLTSAVRKASSRAPLHAALPGTLAALLQEGEDAPPPMQVADGRPEAGADFPTEVHLRLWITQCLLTGSPGQGWSYLSAHASDHLPLLAAQARDLARAHVEAIPSIAERLLAWCLPMELLTALTDDPSQTWATHAQRVSLVLATAPHERTAWLPIVIALLRGTPPPWPEPSLPWGASLDRFGRWVTWLDAAMSAPHQAEAPPGDILTQLSFAQLTELFLAADLAQTTERIGLTLRTLTAEASRRLLSRLVPWATSSTGPLAGILNRLEATQQMALLTQAAGMGLWGAELDLKALTAIDTARSPAPHPGPGNGHEADAASSVSHCRSEPDQVKVFQQGDDAARLFAWLEGAPVASAEAARLGRCLASMIDAGHVDVLRYLAKARTEAKTRARWAALLPPEVLGRVVHVLVPAEARTLLDGMLLLRTAWRQTAGFGARRPEPAALWSSLLDLIAQPTPIDVSAVLAALARRVAGDDTARLHALHHRAVQLAETGGHVSVAAGLRRATSSGTGSIATPAQPPARVSTPHRSAPSPEPAASPHTEPRGALHVANAGLVLLGPFLPTLFERLSILTQDEAGVPRIVGVEAASRGVHLLQYLVDGRVDRTEPELALNKLLCGLPTTQPIARSIDPSADDLAICDELLGAVLSHWPAMKNTSADGLRETFLQREGRLLHGQSKWTLHVQRKTLDVLTDQVPWSFALVYHRWMIDPIHVTW